ncbi:hypothetical protein GCM10009558_079480 [Virgisporangium aurantiacum]
MTDLTDLVRSELTTLADSGPVPTDLADRAVTAGVRRHRLRHHGDGREPGRGGGVDQDVLAVRSPVGGMGEHGLRRRATGVPDGFGGDAGEHGGDHAGHRELVVAEQNDGLVDATLRVRFVPGRVESGAAVTVAAGEKPAAGVGEHGRRQQRRRVEQQRLGSVDSSAVGCFEVGDGVGGAEIDPEPVAHGGGHARHGIGGCKACRVPAALARSPPLSSRHPRRRSCSCGGPQTGPNRNNPGTTSARSTGSGGAAAGGVGERVCERGGGLHPVHHIAPPGLHFGPGGARHVPG